MEPEHVSCEVCRKEIPESTAMSHEAEEYIIHFCGIECYSEWQKERPEDASNKKG
jgi:hypothetical protein